jgi:hypothetical protein
MLDVFVFDDSDSEMTSYLGVAKISLISLANDKPIKGTFELRKVIIVISFKLCRHHAVFPRSRYDSPISKLQIGLSVREVSTEEF